MELGSRGGGSVCVAIYLTEEFRASNDVGREDVRKCGLIEKLRKEHLREQFDK